MVTAALEGEGFREGQVEADGFDIRYFESGEGPALCCFHGAGGLQLSRSHQLLAEHHRVVAFELPGFGASAVNDRSASLRDLSATMAHAIAGLGITSTSLWGISFGGKLALWLAVERPELLDALVLESPAAIRDDRPLPEGPALFRALYAHPERLPDEPPPAPEMVAKHQAITRRLIGPPRDAELEAAMRAVLVPTLVVFGTEDQMTPPELGRHYPALMANAHLVLVYDAAHAVDRDRPEAFAATVVEFLSRHEQFVVRQESGLLYP